MELETAQYFNEQVSGYRQTIADLSAALREFMDIWGSRDAHSPSKRAQQRRAAMWDKAKAAIAKAEGGGK